MRVALYYTPAPGSTLARLGADWLGRDAFTGLTTRPADPLRDPLLAEAARYGIHGTLKAPFRLTDDRDLPELTARLAVFCAARPAPLIRRLVLARLGSFFALVPTEPEPAIATLEGDVVRAFEPFRAPLTEAEVAARRPERLSARQLALLHAWGYPFVLDEFRFHITLSGPVEAPDLRPAIEAHFAAVIDRPLPLDGIGVFVEPARGAPFRIETFHPFGAATAPQPAGTP